ncbi:hypothetical protein, conserved [Babesia bigemina]|uniref:Uncharacterized protein n=1 Tax=Babesia bigemina TaxID=5866 RepID=A0A061DB23_BABBI|nr:hypothetical protein, conserved [Babesia bigemina]CDR94925.1 hypothetical protein, conserved [Babesia bigemina]|eukprot:XP_012767111.1 hypothetical protein, conserved [Babesia bigemina]
MDDNEAAITNNCSYSLRKRKRPVIVEPVEYDDDDGSDLDSFRVEDEAKAWDMFYSDRRQSDEPFSGVNAKEAVSMIYSAIRRIRSPPLVDSRDFIMEVGHGKHPLIWDLQRAFKNFGSYTGVEFSGDSILEAINLRARTHESEEASDLADNVEFLRATSINYFNSDGSCNAEVIIPADRYTPRLTAGSVTLVLAKSTLDYITCRLTGSVSTLNWDENPRISPAVVEMFDSFSTALGKVSESRPKAIIFVEPGDFIKFRDHIATIARVIYDATFRRNSPAKWLRLTHVRRNKTYKAAIYTLEKTNQAYESYQEMRDDIRQLTARIYELSGAQDDDWLLPTTVPPRWNTHNHGDFEQLSAI